MIVGSFCYTDEEFRAALAQVATLDPSQLVTSIELDQGVTVFDQLLAGRTDRVKVMLAPDKGGALK
jgi:threonine dehydrogenase-like Zn-dependent dehydrogenase